MSATFMLKKRMEQGNTWKFGLPGSVMGGQDDSYVRPFGNCHPDYMGIPIGNPEGVLMCVRRVDECGRRFGNTLQQKSNADIQDLNGYQRAAVNLYDPTAQLPTQKWNPQYFSDRRIPWEQDLIRHDYLRWPIKYDATGVEVLHAPAQGRDEGKPYYQYAYDFTPVEDPDTGMRVAKSINDNAPEIKYDITRLHQAYPLWKSEQAVFGRNQDKYDTRYFGRII